ncbi:MAG: hemin uptake protein HemP [Thioalkalivibrionaceae bacterium]
MHRLLETQARHHHEGQRAPRASSATGGQVTISIRSTSNDPISASKKTSSAQLFGDAKQIEIEHGDMTYTLRITAAGKLLLTK